MTTLCPNCNSDKHRRCCARCGAVHVPARNGFEFCSKRCTDAQHEEDEASATMEEASCGCAETYPQLNPDRLAHGPGCASTPAELVPTVPEIKAERIEPEDDRPPVGSWWWVPKSKNMDIDDCDVGTKWLACVIAVGSNYAELEGVRRTRRVSIEELHETCEPAENFQAFIDEKIGEHKGHVRELMGEIQRVCHQLGVPMHAALAAAESAAQALATTSGTEDAKAYGEALVKAKDKTLPELFERVKAQHRHLATWMKAELIPVEAELTRAKEVTGRIEDKIHTVELYAGLKEELVCVREGAGANVDERVHLMQRRHYMDEECLARYEAGGMDFKDIEAFDKWISRDEHMTRILPHDRCIVAFRIRRNDKEYGGHRDTLANFIKFWRYNEANKQTFLYIRNGRQLWRMTTSINFGSHLFPNREDDDLLGDDELWVNPEGRSEPSFITGQTYAGMINRWKERRTELARELWAWKRLGKPKKDWIMPGATDSAWIYQNGKQNHTVGGRTGRPDSHRINAGWKNYSRITPNNIYFDDAMAAQKRAAFEHNRVAVVIQGLLDRSTCLHPHPPWKLWTPEGFERALALIYDVSRALTPGEEPDWHGYHAQLNKSIRVGAIVIGQKRAFAEAMEELHGEKWEYRANVGHGPTFIDEIEAIRGGKAKFSFTRARRRAIWVPADRPGYIRRSYPEIEASWWCPLDQLTCIDAYTPGDFRLFFDDPRTRAKYLQWAPILLTAEDYHAKRREVPSVPTPKPEADDNDDTTVPNIFDDLDHDIETPDPTDAPELDDADDESDDDDDE